MTIELWQVPVVIAALVLILAYPVAWLAEGWHPSTEDPEPTRPRWAAARVRTIILVLLSTILLGLLIVTFQGWELSSAAASVAVVASLILEGFALRLTYLSYQEQKKLERILMTASPLPRDKAERPE